MTDVTAASSGGIQTLSACLSVADLRRSASWYQEVLGFVPSKQADFPALNATAVFLRNGRLRLELVSAADSSEPRRLDPPRHNQIRGLSQLAVYVADLDVTLARLAWAGVSLAMAPVEVSTLGLRSCFIRDPDGNLVEILQDDDLRSQAREDPPANDALFAAARRADLEEALGCLDRGAEVNRRESHSGLTALMVAAGRGDERMVQLLIEHGADVLAVDAGAGASVLHKACQGGSVAVVRALVEAGAFVDAVAPTTGHTPLMDALWFKWPQVVDYLLEVGAGLNLATHYGFSLQEHFAYELSVNTIGKDRLEAADQMLKRRLEADETAVRSQRLMAALVADDLHTVVRLLRLGARVDERAPRLNGFNDGHTPLHVAARDGHTAIVSALLDAGADVNAVEPVFGAVPLHKAVYNGHADITAALLTRQQIQLDFQGATNGYTPLHDALWHGYEECASLLVEAGASLELLGHDNKTPLDLAIEVFGGDHRLVARIHQLIQEPTNRALTRASDDVASPIGVHQR